MSEKTVTVVDKETNNSYTFDYRGSLSSYKVDGYDIDMNLSLGENLADIGGLIICEDALETIYNEMKLSETEKEARYKTFYKYYISEWKEKTRKKTTDIQMKTNEHLHSKYRCNGTLMNSENFKKIYKIKKGDKMFNENIVAIW